MIDKELLEILACPACKADVVLDEPTARIVCTACGRRYPDRKSTRLNSSHIQKSRMPSSA